MKNHLDENIEQVRALVARACDELSGIHCLADGTESPVEINPNAVYYTEHLERLWGPRFVQRVRPCAFANGQWVGKAIIDFLAGEGTARAAVKSDTRQDEPQKLSARTKQLQTAIQSYKNPVTLNRKGGKNGNQKNQAGRAGNNRSKPAG